MPQEFIFVKKNGRFEKVSFSELLFIKGMRGYLQLVTDTQVYFVLNTLEEVQKQLPEELFCRVHRSYIVCLNRIVAFDNLKIMLRNLSDSEKQVGVTPKNEIPVGRAFRKKLKDSVTIIPNKLNKYSKTLLNKAEFLREIDLEVD